MSPPPHKELPALSSPISVLPDQIANRSTTLILEETASGFDFDVKDGDTGLLVFHVKGKIEGSGVIKEVRDAKGTHLFTLHKERSYNPKNYQLLNPDGSLFLDTQWKWGFKSATLTTVLVNSADKTPVMLSMDASYYSRRTDVTLGEQVAAHLFRDFYTGKDIFKGRRTYYLSVAPGMDMAAALAVTLYTHERVNETYSGFGSSYGTSSTAS